MEYAESAHVEMNYYSLSLELEQSKAQIQSLEGHISNLDPTVKALEETIFMKPDYADAHCDLASALHAMGEDDRAIEVF